MKAEAARLEGRIDGAFASGFAAGITVSVGVSFAFGGWVFVPIVATVLTVLILIPNQNVSQNRNALHLCESQRKKIQGAFAANATYWQSMQHDERDVT